MTATIDFAPIRLSCTGKERYGSAALAAKVAKRRTTSKKMRHKTPTKPLHPYRCPHCSTWHIGGGKTPGKAKQTKGGRNGG